MTSMRGDDWTPDPEAVGAISRLTQARDGGDPYLDLGIDPSQAELAGKHLAALLERYRPTMVVSWAGENDVVLAHIVARQLGIPRASLELDLGLLTVGQAIAAGTRGVLVGAEGRDGQPIRTVETLLEGNHSTLAAAGYLRPVGDWVSSGTSVPILSLVS